MVRDRHRVRISVPFRPIAMRSAVLFRKLSYSCKIWNETQSFRSTVLFRSGNYTNPFRSITCYFPSSPITSGNLVG